MTLSHHVRTLARGPGRARSLTQEEAFDAMSLMLGVDAAPEAVGALLMLLRMKGETAAEIAGFAAAARGAMREFPSVDLDWPSYAAGRTRGAPWFLLSARLVAHAGHRVLLHGWNGDDTTVRDGLARLGIGVATSPSEVADLLDRDQIAYLPLETAHPALFRLLSLRRVLGLRSCVNTVCRMLNPAAASASVQGVFHPSYRLLQADAASLLNWDSLTVIKGGGGEFERHPGKEIAAFGLRHGKVWDENFPALRQETRRMAEPSGPAPTSSWENGNPTQFEAEIVVGTLALALDSLGHANSYDTARQLFHTHMADLAA